VDTRFSPTSTSSTPDEVSGIATAVKFHFNAAKSVSYRIEQSTDLQT
jgi:hypothetical protein